MQRLLDIQQVVLNAAYREHLLQAHDHMIEHKDAPPATVFAEGDYVLVCPPEGRKRKLNATWLGPFRVVSSLANNGYVIQNLVTQGTLERHVSTLKPYLFSQDPEKQTPLQTAARDSDEYEVEDIRQHRPVRPTRENAEFLVTWKGSPATDTARDWISYESLKAIVIFQDYCHYNRLHYLFPQSTQREIIKRHKKLSPPTPPTLLLSR
jgi:hypothetical protein